MIRGSGGADHVASTQGLALAHRLPPGGLLDTDSRYCLVSAKN